MIEGLTNSQKVFCQEYIYDWNATRAYKVAYPNIKNDQVAWAASSRLLGNVKVKVYLESIQKDLEKLAGISRLRIANEFRKIAFSSIASLHNTWIERKDFEEIPLDQKECIQEIETKTIRRPTPGEKGAYEYVEYVKIKLYDKLRALDSLCKMLGYNEPEKRDVTVTTAEMPTVIIERDPD